MPQEGMQTKVWGPMGWGFIYCTIMGYPEQIDESNTDHIKRKQGMDDFLNSLQYTLPCSLCRDSYIKFYKKCKKKIPQYLETRDTLLEFMYCLHNKVNNKLKVDKEGTPSLENVHSFYEQFRASCSSTGCERAAKNKHKIKCDVSFKKSQHNENAPDEFYDNIHKNKDLYSVISEMMDQTPSSCYDLYEKTSSKDEIKKILKDLGYNISIKSKKLYIINE